MQVTGTRIVHAVGGGKVSTEVEILQQSVPLKLQCSTAGTAPPLEMGWKTRGVTSDKGFCGEATIFAHSTVFENKVLSILYVLID